MEALCHIMNGDNVLVNLSVGYGKSLIYHLLPALLKTNQLNQPMVILISPMNIIQKDQLSTLSDHSVPSFRLNIETRLGEFTDDGILYRWNQKRVWKTSSLEDFVWFFVTQRSSLTPALEGSCQTMTDFVQKLSQLWLTNVTSPTNVKLNYLL